jgi:putative oxidoreductase
MQKIIRPLISTKITEAKTSIALLVFRVLLSISLFNTHGLKKILDFEGTLQHIPDPFGFGSEFSAYMAVFANVICPVFVVLGLFTRAAILPIVGITLSGFFIVHASDPWAVRDIPFMYSLSFLLLLYLGAGKYSLDAKLLKK